MVSVPWVIKLSLLTSALGAGGLVCLIIDAFGWSAWIAVALGASAAAYSYRCQRAHCALSLARIDKGAADACQRQWEASQRAMVVTWSAIGGGVMGYVLACVLLLDGSSVAQMLHEIFGPAAGGVPRGGMQRTSPHDPWWVKYPPENPGVLGVLRYVLAAVGAFAAGQVVRRLIIPPAGQRPGPRGRRLMTYQEAIAASRKCLPRGDPGLAWGGILLPSAAATSHFCVVGTTGSGKTMLLRLLQQSALPFVGRGLDHRALVYDPKQDVLSYLAGMGNVRCRIEILNPFDARCAAWDMAADCDSPAVAMQIASILVPEEETGNRFFSDSSRHLLGAVLISLIRTCPRRWDFRDVVLAMQNGPVIRAFIDRLPETRHLAQYWDEPRTFANILSTLATKFATFEPIAAAWSHAHHRISLRSWVCSESILVLGNDERIRFPMDAINRLIFRRVSEMLLAQSDSATRRTWMFLDEVREAGKLDGLSAMLVKGRSRGVAVALGLQDIDGLRAVYKEMVANELLGQCSNKAILRLESPDTARWSSSVFGDFEHYEYHTSKTTNRQGKSETVNETLAKREAVLPSEFMSLPPTTRATGLSGYFITPYIGAYRATIPGEALDRQLKGRDPSTADFVPRPTMHEYLQPWTASDYRRLGLLPPSAGSSGVSPRPSNPRPSLPKIVGRSHPRRNR